MGFEEVLKNAESNEITKGEALYLFKKTGRYDKVLRLFETASRVRDDEVGNVFKLDGFIGAITPCTIKPPCKYCGTGYMYASGAKVLTIDEISEGAKLIEETGISMTELGGGTTLGSDGKSVVEAVKAVKSVTDLDIWVNVGPALPDDALKELKNLGGVDVTSSFEVNPLNEELFRKVKPGDDLDARKKLASMINDAGLGLNSVLMSGLGETYEDRVDHMFYLKQFESLKYFLCTWFRPVPGTPFGDRPLTSPLEAAKTAAIARLIYRDIDIHCSGYEHIPLWIMAGVNRVVHAGASVYQVRDGTGMSAAGAEVKRINDRANFVNLLPTTVKIITEAGMKVEPKIADNYEVTK